MDSISNSKSANGLKAVIIGSTGAIGRVIYYNFNYLFYSKKVLVRELCASSAWNQVSVIVRRRLPEWENIEGI